MTKNRTALCIVPCGKSKIWQRDPTRGAVPAREAYIGTFAAATRAYAERFYESWVILSAKYGLLHPTDLIDGPYEVTFKRKKDPALITIAQLQRQIAAKGLDAYREIVVVAGKAYFEPVRAAFGSDVRVVTPLSGIGRMGAMASALRKSVAAGKPLCE